MTKQLRKHNIRTAQEIFDTVVAHLRQQNSKAMTTDPETCHQGVSGTMCAYRGEDGKKCAVGILIPDESYSPFMENVRISDLIRENGRKWTFPTTLLTEFIEYKQLLDNLQSVHDTYEVRTWEAGFAKVAERFDLKYTPKIVEDKT